MVEGTIAIVAEIALIRLLVQGPALNARGPFADRGRQTAMNEPRKELLAPKTTPPTFAVAWIIAPMPED